MSRHLMSASIGALGALAVALPASAQDTPKPADTPVIEEVTVTARRTEENLQKIPVAETVVKADNIESLAINTPLDLNKIAGLSSVPIGALTAVNFALRGQGDALSGQPGVIPYFAEVSNFPLTYYDLNNVQVIKGPQGTLFGQTATGGVVLFEPKRPTDIFGGYLDVQGGGYDYRQVEGAINIPLVADKLLFRAAFQIRDRDGWAKGEYADGQTEDNLNNINNTSFRLSATWRPTNKLENYIMFSRDTIENNGTESPLYYIDTRYMNPGAAGLIPASIPSIAAAYQFWSGNAPPPGQTFAQLLSTAFQQQQAAGPLTMFTDFSQHNTTVNTGWVDQTTWDILDNLRVKNIFGLYYSTQQGATYDQDATSLPLLEVRCQYAPGATSATSPCAKIGGWPDRTLTEEMQLQGHLLEDRLQWQIGGFYLQSGKRDLREDTPPYVVFGSLSGDPANSAFCASIHVANPCQSMSRTNTYSYAFFGQATYAILSRFHLTAGYRESWDYSRTDTTGEAAYQVPYMGQLITVPIYGGTPAPGATFVSTVVNLPANASYNISADWQLNDDVLLYVAHRSGYKSGGINTIAAPGTPDRVYGPEHVKDVEIGAKSEWTLGGVRGQLNADFFHTWYTNIQEDEIIPGSAETVTTNLANANINGVEIEGTIVPIDWFRISGNLAYTDADYSNWVELSTCALQYWRPQCSSLPSVTPITINHSAGYLDIAGQTIRFSPDQFSNTSKWQWSIRPEILLKRWLGEDVTLGANIYHRGPYVDATASANTSVVAGVSPLVEKTVFGYSTSNPFDAPGYTLADLRVDWRHAFGSHASLAAGVTNVTNSIYRVSSASPFEIIGDVYSLIGEPRMWFVDVKYEF